MVKGNFRAHTQSRREEAKRLALWSLCLVLAVNALLLAGVAWNRSGEPQARLLPSEREVPSRDGRRYAVRILPYRTQDEVIDGAVLTFVDISASRAGVSGTTTLEGIPQKTP